MEGKKVKKGKKVVEEKEPAYMAVVDYIVKCYFCLYVSWILFQFIISLRDYLVNDNKDTSTMLFIV